MITLNEIFFALIAFATNIVQAITGFAGTVLAMPASIKLVGYSTARPILTFISIFICLFVVIFNFKKIQWKNLLFLLIFVGAGYGLGFLVQYININQDILMKIYGVIICIIALVFLIFPNIKVPKFLYPFILIIAGIIQFLYTSGGPLVIIYASSAIQEKDEFRSTLSLMWLILNSITFTTNLVHGDFTGHVWLLTLIVTLVSIASLILGHIIAKKINQKVFKIITYVLLFISGLIAII